ncbi:uncharacterized protein LOC122529233 isoform X1 [Frieseomelitta varia]|uniref:uncharacterized protein LOC122529233 isoform X1 n=1 Tax=Frieseomelitta varia TaxID=561572 RepID=UPI001CB694E9|nr:uncharacterized protein LOC122529233 isoform X1 [Frieseomelitta varia]
MHEEKDEIYYLQGSGMLAECLPNVSSTVGIDDRCLVHLRRLKGRATGVARDRRRFRGNHFRYLENHQPDFKNRAKFPDNNGKNNVHRPDETTETKIVSTTTS